MKELQSDSLVITSQAQCRDCYRCLRVCPVKAIRLKEGQASVDDQLCIGCGTCIRECPQHAKQYRRDLDKVIEMIRQGEKVAVSIAPSMAVVWSDWRVGRLASALRRCGFQFIAETAYGASLAARLTQDYFDDHSPQGDIMAACPAVVTYIEKYFPEMTDRLLPIPSPMIVHGRFLKDYLGPDWKVVFIGPCVAKKAEAGRSEYAGVIDAVITFEELQDWLNQEGIDLKNCEESPFDQQVPGPSRNYPLPGGALASALLPSDLLSSNHIAISGGDALNEALVALKDQALPVLLEPLFCQHGCIDGPALGTEDNLLVRRARLLDYTQSKHEESSLPDNYHKYESVAYHSQNHDQPQITEDQIRAILEQTGKIRPEDQLNCGACGYSSCRENAIAVIRGMAEIEMCMPYMRRMAERRTDRIIETSPNGIIILDHDLKVISMNPSFQTMFMCSGSFLGRQIAELIDPEPFERLVAGEEIVESIQKYESYRLICQQICYALREERQYVGIFVNITSSQLNQKKLDSLRAQTILQAQDLLKHQIEMARQIAGFLGESTAQGEQLVENLMKLAQDEPSRHERKASLWDIYTSK